MWCFCLPIRSSLGKWPSCASSEGPCWCDCGGEMQSVRWVVEECFSREVCFLILTTTPFRIGSAVELMFEDLVHAAGLEKVAALTALREELVRCMLL
jgi:hypothetical protein